MIRFPENGCAGVMIAFLSLLLLALAGCSHHHYSGLSGDEVKLFLEFPAAETVLFASSADDFQVRPAHRDRGGRWLVEGLKNEEFAYFYVVDGELFVPECRYSQQDDFGTTNCIYQP